MNTIITFCTKNTAKIVFSVVTASVLVFFVFPILSAQHTGALAPDTVYAEDFDYGFDVGYFDDGCCNWSSSDSFDYGIGVADVVSEPYSPNFDYGIGASDVTNQTAYPYFDYGVDSADIVDDGCCESSYVPYESFDYGIGAAEVIDDGCCESSYVPYESFDYGIGAAEIIDDGCCEPNYESFDYGIGAAEVIDDGCCEPNSDSFDYGIGAAEVIDDGCCEPVETPEAPVHPIAPEEPYYPEYYPTVPDYTYPTVPNYTEYIGGGYSYTSTPYTPTTYGGYTSTNYYTPYTPYIQTPYTPIAPGEYVRIARCDSFSVSETRVDDGDEVTLTWNTTNATEVRINNGVGSVSNDGSRRVEIQNDTTFTLTASNGQGSDTCQVTVRIGDTESVRCDAFTVSDSRVDEGDRVTLTWRTTNADSVRISDGVGNVDDDGEKTVRIDDDTTFELTARNGSDSDTCRVTVEVDEDDNTTSLRCELAVSDKSIRSGERVKLSWDNRGADRIVLKDNHGKEIADSRDDRNLDEDKDSIYVSPRETTTYKLTAYDGSKTKTCSVEVVVSKDVTVTSTRSQIPLTDIPYTGFGAGPFLTAVFYTILALWGLGVGYVLVMRRRALAVAGDTGVLAMEMNTAPIVASVAAPVGTSTMPFNLPTTETIETEMEEVEEEGEDDAMMILEQYAHDRQVLLSSDALRFILSESQTEEERQIFLDTVIDQLKGKYPSEDGWTVLNRERLMELFKN